MYILCNIAGCHSLSFKTTMDAIEWSDSRRVDHVLSRRIHHMCYILDHMKQQRMTLIGHTVGGLSNYNHYDWDLFDDNKHTSVGSFEDKHNLHT